MATPAPGFLSQVTLEALGDLYLSLWKQLDLLSNEGKWIELRPIDPSQLKTHVDQRMDEVRGAPADSSILKVIERDYSRTQEFVSSSASRPEQLPTAEHAQFEALKTYLRDAGLRYEEEAGQEGEPVPGVTGHIGD